MAEKKYRIGVTFTFEDYQRFLALAAFDDVKPATLAAEILKEYMDKRTDDIDLALDAKKKFDTTLANTRNSRRLTAD